MFSYQPVSRELSIDFVNTNGFQWNPDLAESILIELQNKLHATTGKVTAINILNLNKYWLDQIMAVDKVAKTSFFNSFNQLLRSADVNTATLTGCDMSASIFLLFKDSKVTSLTITDLFMTPTTLNVNAPKEEKNYVYALSDFIIQHTCLEKLTILAPFVFQSGGHRLVEHADKLYSAIAQSNVRSLTLSSDLIQEVSYPFAAAPNIFWDQLTKLNCQHLKLISTLSSWGHVGDDQIIRFTQLINAGKLPSLCTLTIDQNHENNAQVLANLTSALQQNRQRIVDAINGQDAFASILNHTDRRIPAEIAHSIVYFGMYSIFGNKKLAIQQTNEIITKAVERSESTPRTKA